MVLRRVRVTVDSDYVGDPAVSTAIEYRVEVDADAPEEAVRRLVERVDGIAEIPNSIRQGTEVVLTSLHHVGRAEP